MKLIQNGANRTTLKLDDGTEIYISYSTPVGAFVPGVGCLRTEAQFSRTTSKHLGQFGVADAPKRPQAFFDALMKMPSAALQRS